MSRFRLSTDGGSVNTADNTIYYLSGENKRPNIISRPKTKSGGVAAVPTTTTAQQQQQQQIVYTSETVQEALQVPTTMASPGTSTEIVETQTVETIQTEGEDPVCVPIQMLDEAASAEFLRANNLGNHQIITDANGAMTIETEDGNVMVILQDDDDESTTTGTIAFGNEMEMVDANTQLIQNVQFPGGEMGGETVTMDFGGDNDMPETTSYVLVQVDNQGNNILVPASVFSNHVNGIPTVTQVPARTTHHQHQQITFTTEHPTYATQHQQHQQQQQTVRTTTAPQQNYNPGQAQERGKPFRYILPESEEAGMRMEDGNQFILNVLPGPSQPEPISSELFPTASDEEKAKPPPKPRRPRPTKKTQAEQQSHGPLATSTPLPGKFTGKPQVQVAVVSQLMTPTSSNPQPIRPALPAATSTLVVNTTPGAPSQENPGQGNVDNSEAMTQLMEPTEEASQQTQNIATAPPPVLSPSGISGTQSMVSTALGMMVPMAVGPAVPVAKEALTAPKVYPPPQQAAGASKNIIVVGPKPSTSKDTNGAPKKPAEEILVTAFGTFKCTFCFKESTVRSHLVNHINRIHKGEKPFKCKVCNVGFQYSSSLKVHEKNHTMEKPFKCEYCECAFATDSNRNLHQKTVHSMPKEPLTLLSTPKLKFECMTCKKSYGSKYNLLCHRLTHVDDFTKPIVCDICKKECKTKAILVNHVQTHKDLNGPFTCNVCNQKFASESRLDVHKIMHKDKNKVYVRVEPVVENRQTPKVDVGNRRNMKISTPTPRRKKGSLGLLKEVFCALCDDVFPNAEALEIHKEKKHGTGPAARTYSKRDPDEYETYIGKVVARKLHQEKPSSSTKTATPKQEAGGSGGVVKRGPGRPRKADSVGGPSSPKRGPGRPGRKPGVAAAAKKTPGRKPGPQKRRGRPPTKRKIALSSSDESEEEEEEEPLPEKKSQVRSKEASPKEKLTKPIKKRPIRTDPVSEANSSREPSPAPEADDSRRKSQRKRGKNPYLEELKKKRERKIRAKQNKSKKQKRGGGGDEKGSPSEQQTTPTKRKRIQTTEDSPKKEEDEAGRPLVGTSRGGRKRKLTDSVVPTAIPKKRPYPKEIQDLLAAEGSSAAKNSSETPEDPEGKLGTETPSDSSESSTNKTEGVEIGEESGKTSDDKKVAGEEESGVVAGRSESMEEDNVEEGPSKGAEDSGPPTSSSSDGDEKQADGKVDTSVPMKKRKVIAERDKDETEMGKSFFNIFKQVKKDVSS